MGIELKFSRIEAHNSIGQSKKFCHSLRRIFDIISNTNPKIDNNSKLNFSIKAMSDTMGPNGLVPSLLDFGTLL